MRPARSLLVLAICVVGACAPEEPVGARAAAFRDAAARHDVPEDWLLVLGYQQSRFELDAPVDPDAPMDPEDVDDAGGDALADDTMVDEAGEGTDDDGAPGGDDATLPVAWGVMQLTDAQVARAAELTGRDPDEIRGDVAANVDAAAALLAEARDAGGDLRDATAALLGVAGDPDVRALALGDLDATLAAGFELTTTDGERVVLDGTDPGAERIAPVAPGKYPPRDFIASPNHSSRLGYAIRYVVVHDIEGTMAGAISVFRSSASQASAHYIVRARDGHIVQMVREGDNAWHAGHGWFNRHSIGIEHEGFAGRKRGGGFYNETQYRASAALVCAIAHRHHIPVDRKHVFGHYNVPSNLGSHKLCSDRRGAAGKCGGISHHSDPGRFWKWNHYLRLIRDCVQAAG